MKVVVGAMQAGDRAEIREADEERCFV